MKFLAPAVILAALASAVLAVPHGPKPSGRPPPPPPPPSHPPIKDCRAQPLCCIESLKATSRSIEGLLEVFHVRLSKQEEQELVGLTCSHININERRGPECFFQPLCCDKELAGGVFAVGCTQSKL